MTMLQDNDQAGGLDRLLEMEHQLECQVIDAQKKLLMRLNKAELLVLAKHYAIKHPEDYTAAREWQFGGKEELAGEIAAKMVE
jgi:hypothetical protein